MAWQKRVGGIVAFIGAALLIAGTLGFITVDDPEEPLFIPILGAGLIIGGLFFSRLGNPKKSDS